MSPRHADWPAIATHSDQVLTSQHQLLLAAPYALVPAGTPPPAWSRWDHPDGQACVPCFLSEASAREAAGNQAQVVRVAGREFLESLGDTPLWVDPAGVSVFLTPPQVRALLAATPAPTPVSEDRTLAAWTVARDLPAAVHAVWLPLLTQSPQVLAAYWLGQPSAGGPVRRRLVLLTAGTEDTPRLLSAMVMTLRATYVGAMRIEAQALAAGELPEAESRLGCFEAFYP